MTSGDDQHPVRRWGPTALVIAAVAFGVTMRWWKLGGTSLWFDEGYTAWVVSLPPAKIIEAIRFDTAPPLYYLLLKPWVMLVGTSEAAMRFPSAACATAALAVMTAVIRRLFQDRWARAVAVTLVACSFMQVAYAHEVRFYALMSLVGAVDLYLALQACERDRPAVRWLVAASVAWSVSLWLNNIMVVYLGCLGLAWLILPGRRPFQWRLVDAAIVGVTAGLTFLPWVPALLAQRRAMQANFWSHCPNPGELRDMIKLLAGVNEAADGAGGFFVAVALVTGVVVGWRRWRLVGPLLIFGLGPVVLTFVYSRHATPIFMDRAFIVSSLILPLLAAVPLELAVRPGARTAAGAVVAILLGLSIPSVIQDRQRVPDHIENWRDACRYAATFAANHRLTVFNANEGEWLYDYYARSGDYAPRSDLTATPIDVFNLHPPHTLRRVTTDADVEPLRRLLAERPGDAVVLVSGHSFYADHDGRTLRLLRDQLRQTDERQFDAVTVYRFVPRLMTVPSAERGHIQSGPPS
jgi:hypothetical protein